MTETTNAYYTDKTPPLIKMTAFTDLSEQEVAKMRSFRTVSDPLIQPGEVFFYMPNSGGAKNIEGDDRFWESNKRISAAFLNEANPMNRRKVETLQSNGSSVTEFRELAATAAHANDQRCIKVMWLNPVTSPDSFVQVRVNLK
jgi:predicted secreted protein